MKSLKSCTRGFFLGWRKLYDENDSVYIEYSDKYEQMKKRWAREKARSLHPLDLETIFRSWWMHETLHQSN